ncbi:MAG: T9SS type A sorting domain-containing protein [Flavobacteriaceae bacterium]|nr:MAG: T9SS type A sorting domain-containing protein [Flavobacteriaceae bacterium]
MIQKIIFLFFALLLSKNSYSQVEASDWVKGSYSNVEGKNSKEKIMGQLPTNYSVWKISTEGFTNRMHSIENQEITLPTPDGKFEQFIISPSQVISDEVTHLYTIKTFTGYKKDNPGTLISCDISETGFHAAVYNKDNSFFIEPVYKESSETVIAYYKKDYITEKLKCNTETAPIEEMTTEILNRQTPTTKITYRLAIAAAGEYSQQFGGSPYSATNVLNALASGVNMINPVFLRDLGVTFTLVSNTALVYPDPNTDPFNIGDDVSAAHTACTNALGSSGFDVGHMVIWANTGGAAAFGVVCNDAAKGLGFSGNTNSTTTLWIDYVSHEIGHQFRSEHNFVSQECNQSASGFRYEPGEGSSIMSYANVCGGAAQYAPGSDPFFHYASIDQMQAFLNTISCGTMDSSGNTASPTANANADITVPKQTPFILVGTGTDANDPSGNLTYGWQQYDGSGTEVTGSPNCNATNAPMFRYRPPTSNNYRSFPQYGDILAGNNDRQWERLPCVARTMNFSLAVRDNNSSFGRIGEDRAVVMVADTGPFNVTSPNGGETLTGNASHTVTWTVNGTNAHCGNVDILVSTDGGNTYSVVANATSNDGTESITVPNTASTTARVLVRCDVAGGFRAASTFYDVSNANFTINTVLGIDDVESLGVSVYPNPVSNEVFIKLTNSENYTYQLFDVSGRSIKKGEFNDSISIQTSYFQTGIYFLELTLVNSGKRVVKKLIIQN